MALRSFLVRIPLPFFFSYQFLQTSAPSHSIFQSATNLSNCHYTKHPQEPNNVQNHNLRQHKGHTKTNYKQIKLLSKRAESNIHLILALNPQTQQTKQNDKGNHNLGFLPKSPKTSSFKMGKLFSQTEPAAHTHPSAKIIIWAKLN
ncbi:hypothetical protein Droror1_Dr00010183 [Drosera rotundifolia]